MQTNLVNKLPQNPKDGDAVVDKFGNVWQYDGGRDSWVNRGAIDYPGPVTETAPGTVTPEVFRKLAHLRQVYSQDPDRFTSFKIAPGLDAYWYYFRSSNKLFRFIPEGPSRLRIEVDRSRLYQILMKQSCPGVKGLAGDRGDQGPAGADGALEIAYTPSGSNSGVDEPGDRLDFAIFTPTPIGTPISLRLYRGASALSTPLKLTSKATPRVGTALAPRPETPKEQLAFWSKYLKDNGFTDPNGVVERQLDAARAAYSGNMYKQAVACDFPLSRPLGVGISSDALVEIHIALNGEVTIVDPGLGKVLLDQTRTKASISYDPASRVLCGSLFLAGDVWGGVSGWALRARQIGPQGEQGLPGECKVSVVECDISDTSNMLATCPVINVRADCSSEIVYWVCSQIVPEIYARQLQLTVNSATVSDQRAMQASFGSVKATIEEFKPIYYYKVKLPSYSAPDLDLMHWEPQAGCVSHANFDKFDFNWIPFTDLPACNNVVTWLSPDGPQGVKFPWPALTQSDPGVDHCCSDQFFYCQNSQTVQPPPIVCVKGTGVTGPGGESTPGETGPSGESTPGASTPAPLTSLCLSEYNSNNVLVSSVTLLPVSASYQYPVGVNKLAQSIAGQTVWRGCGMRCFTGSKTAQPAVAGTACQKTDLVQVPVVYELFCFNSSSGDMKTQALELGVSLQSLPGGTAFPVKQSAIVPQALGSSSDDKLTLFMSFPVCPTGSRDVASPDAVGMGGGSGPWTCDSFKPKLNDADPVKSWVKTLQFADSRTCTAGLAANPAGVEFNSTFLMGPYANVSKIRLTTTADCSLTPPCTTGVQGVSVPGVSVPGGSAPEASTPLGGANCPPAPLTGFIGWSITDEWGELPMYSAGIGSGGTVYRTFSTLMSTEVMCGTVLDYRASVYLYYAFSCNSDPGLSVSSSHRCSDTPGTPVALPAPVWSNMVDGIPAVGNDGQYHVTVHAHKITVTQTGDPEQPGGFLYFTMVRDVTQTKAYQLTGTIVVPNQSLSKLNAPADSHAFYDRRWNLTASSGSAGVKRQAFSVHPSGAFTAYDVVGPDAAGFLYGVCYVLRAAGDSLQLDRYFYERYDGAMDRPTWNGGDYAFDPAAPRAPGCGAVDSAVAQFVDGPEAQLTFGFRSGPLSGGVDFKSTGGCTVNVPYVNGGAAGMVNVTVTGVR